MRCTKFLVTRPVFLSLIPSGPIAYITRSMLEWAMRQLSLQGCGILVASSGHACVQHDQAPLPNPACMHFRRLQTHFSAGPYARKTHSPRIDARLSGSSLAHCTYTYTFVTLLAAMGETKSIRACPGMPWHRVPAHDVGGVLRPAVCAECLVSVRHDVS